MKIALYITGHGFGHATRALAVAEAIRAKAPEAEFFIRTPAPWEFIETSFAPPFEYEPVRIDTGGFEKDGLRTDEEKTIRVAREFYANADAIADSEARFLNDHNIDIVVFDVPPLAAEIAARARVPSVAIANFTWDRIYKDYPDSLELVEQLQVYQHKTTLALEVPLGHEVTVFPTRKRIPIIARTSALEPAQVREELGIARDQAAVLVALREDALPGGAIADTDPRLVFLGLGDLSGPRVRKLDASWQSRFPDLVSACDVVLSKPGYGIVGECIANRTPLLHLPRLGFAETPYLLAEMEALMGNRPISMDEIREGRVVDAIMMLLGQSIPWPSIRTDGAEVAAREIMGLLKG